jgi:hypothetical protein
MKNLNNIFIYLDDSNRDQRHFELIYVFYDEDTNEYFNYRIDFLEGMPLEDFKTFHQLQSSAMKKVNPELCDDGKECEELHI